MKNTLNNNTTRTKIAVKGEKKYLLLKRAAIMVKLRQSGYSFADIGIIFNIDRAWVKRIVDKSGK